MTLYLLEVLLQTFLSITITQKCQILTCDTVVASERHDQVTVPSRYRCAKAPTYGQKLILPHYFIFHFTKKNFNLDAKSTVQVSTVSWLSQRPSQHITCEYCLSKNLSLAEQNTSLHHSVKFKENRIFCSKDSVYQTAIPAFRTCY
jgi:hypothetical protein